MKNLPRIRPIGLFLLGGTLVSLCIPLGGCGPSYRYFRREGQNAVLNGNFGPIHSSIFLSAPPRNCLRSLGLSGGDVCKDAQEQALLRFFQLSVLQVPPNPGFPSFEIRSP